MYTRSQTKLFSRLFFIFINYNIIVQVTEETAWFFLQNLIRPSVTWNRNRLSTDQWILRHVFKFQPRRAKYHYIVCSATENTSCCPPFRQPPTSYKACVYGWQRQASSFKSSNRLPPKRSVTSVPWPAMNPDLKRLWCTDHQVGCLVWWLNPAWCHERYTLKPSLSLHRKGQLAGCSLVYRLYFCVSKTSSGRRLCFFQSRAWYSVFSVAEHTI
jgi:hypothetical protein